MRGRARSATLRRRSVPGRVARTVRPGGQGPDLRAGAVGDDAALADQHDPVGVLVGLLEVVRGEEHRAAALGVAADRRPEGAAALDVHAGGGLVEQQQRGVGEQRHREAQPLLLAARALGDLAAGDLGDAGVGEHVVDRAGVGEQARGVERRSRGR